MSTDELSDVSWDEVKPATMSRRHLEGVNTAMLVLASLAYIARLLVRYCKRKPFESHGFFCGAAFVCFVAMYVMYIRENNPLYRAERVQRGDVPAYAGIRKYILFSAQTHG